MEKKEIWFVIIMSLFTFGIYFLYWIYSFSRDVKYILNDDSINPGLELLLCIITLGLYTIYWMYKYGKLLVKCQEELDLPIEDNAILYLILCIFNFSIIDVGIMQNQLNVIIDANV